MGDETGPEKLTPSIPYHEKTSQTVVGSEPVVVPPCTMRPTHLKDALSSHYFKI